MENSHPAVPDLAPHRVLLVDDHPVFLHGLRAIISEDPQFVVCGEAEDSKKAIAAARSLKPDFAVLDISMPSVNGIELIKMILAEEPRVRILMFSMHDESTYALRALKAGAKGYLMKSESPSSVMDALRRLADGKIHVSSNFTERLIFQAVRSNDDAMQSPVSPLSDRELEILEKIGKGLSTREVAAELHLSHKTVETHRAHIKEKLGFRDSTSMVRFAVEWVANAVSAESAVLVGEAA